MLDARLSSPAGALAQGVFLAAVGEDVVVLDLGHDAYGCLPGAAHAMILGPGSVRATEETLEALRQAGIVREGEVEPTTLLPPAPEREAPDHPSYPQPIAMLRFLLALGAAARLGPAATVESYIAALPARPKREVDEKRIAILTAAFKRWLPWAPGQGACLWRAFVLLSLLRRTGQDATWVFGVRTWPFGAHCWLQAGDRVLDDDPERVVLYTPIMAI